MTLVRFNQKSNPINVMNEFFNSALFDSLHSDFNTNVPAVNVIENENSFSIEVAAPGFNKNDFEVSIDNDVLSISAKVEHENEETTNKFTRKEFSLSSFTRSFKLPKGIEADSIKAQYVNGILNLEIQKVKKVEPQKRLIEIV